MMSVHRSRRGDSGLLKNGKVVEIEGIDLECGLDGINGHRRGGHCQYRKGDNMVSRGSIASHVMNAKSKRTNRFGDRK